MKTAGELKAMVDQVAELHGMDARNIRAALGVGLSVSRVQVTPEGEVVTDTVPPQDFFVNPKETQND